MRRVAFLGAALGAALLAQPASAPRYTKDGKLALPPDYREWIFLSSGLGMTYPNENAPQNPLFDNVFVNPESYRAFMKTGAWPDKTVLIKENRSAETKVSINRDGRVQTNVVSIEANVKDASRGGWLFYAFRKDGREGALMPKTASCYSCHGRNGAVDTTFVQFYPTLIEIAKAKGTFQEER